MGVHVVGYREDPDYFRRCLESVKKLNYGNVRSISVVVDGNDTEDMYMADIAKDVFSNTGYTCLNLTVNPRSEVDGYNTALQTVPRERDLKSGPTVCIVTQPHNGKREVIYTAYKISQLLGVDFFLNTDSDTIMDECALSEMVGVTRDRPTIGAVAGVLTIFNANNWLSKLSASRYVVAFNIERASQSFHGVLNCISGPLGMYKNGQGDSCNG